MEKLHNREMKCYSIDEILLHLPTTLLDLASYPAILDTLQVYIP